MLFGYGDAFKASRQRGYEVMLYLAAPRRRHASSTRGDLVEAAWRVAQPIMDYWNATPASDFPNYARGSWGPKAAADLVARDGRRWHEVVTEEMLKKVEIFKAGDPLFLSQVALSLRPFQAVAGQNIIVKDEIGREMYLITRGEVEVLNDSGGCTARPSRDGDFFGEIAILLQTKPHQARSGRAKTGCDLFVLDKSDFHRILHDHPQFADGVAKVAKERYDLVISPQSLSTKMAK